MRIIAIVAAYNEERFIAGCLEHLGSQGIETFLIDNESTDATVEIARRFLGNGLLRIETLPRDGVYRWRRILARKEELAAELPADWFLHLDPDEVPLPPRPETTLGTALAEVDQAGYDAVEFAEFTFVPTREAPDHDHPGFRQTMHWYYPFAPRPLHLLRAWKRQTTRVDLTTTAGHAVGFEGRRIYPQRFHLRHYLFLSREHARRKYGGKLYDPEELRNQWHGWRANLRADTLQLPPQAELRAAHTDADLDPSSPRTEHCLTWGLAAEPAE